MNEHIRAGLVDYGEKDKEDEDRKRREDAEAGLSEVAKLREVEQIMDTRENDDGTVLC